MTYTLKQVTIRTNNGPEGMEKMGALWADVASGKLSVLQEGIMPIAKYHNYESNHKGDFDMSIIGVTGDFIDELENQTNNGIYKKYYVDDQGSDMVACIREAWQNVWSEEDAGQLSRGYTQDYEISTPAEFSKDGKASCCLYIAIK